MDGGIEPRGGRRETQGGTDIEGGGGGGECPRDEDGGKGRKGER
jgi:hypothetical protein